MPNRKPIDLKERFQFTMGLRFEIFYALQALTDPNSRIHRHWREKALTRMPASFEKEFQTLGNSPTIWPIVADTLRLAPVNIGFEPLIAEVKNQDIGDFQSEILYGAIHFKDIVESLLKKKLTLAEALAKIPKDKREWLAFIGLYPYQRNRDMIVSMELLLRSPERFRDAVVHLLEIFWNHSFKDAWHSLQPQLKRSLEEKERLFESCTFQEFANQALLRIEVDEKNQSINAVRGGDKLPFKKVIKGYILPSAFNDKRYWTTSEENGGSVVFFPYFDPSLAIGPRSSQSNEELADPELDPCLIFKALGDPTRIAIATIIAISPTRSMDLAKVLKISKPAVSHHVHVLREAGIISEARSNGSIHISLKRDVLERLSQLAIDRFFSREAQTRKITIRRHV